MDVAALFLHNAVDERDRVQYGGSWTAEQKATIEAAFDVLVDDPAFSWRHNKPRVPKRVHGGFNHFQIVNWNDGRRFGLKRFTWTNYRYFDTVDEITDCIARLYDPLLEQE